MPTWRWRTFALSMAANDSETLSWMRLEKGFPTKYRIRALINQKAKGRGMNGYEMFTVFFLMLCESIPHGGELRYSKTHPYTYARLADVLCLSEKAVRMTCEVLTDLEILRTLDDGTLKFDCVEENICKTTKGAERVRKMRERNRAAGTNVPRCSQSEPEVNPKRPPNIRDIEYKSIRDNILPPKSPMGDLSEDSEDDSSSGADVSDEIQSSKVIPHLPERDAMELAARSRGIPIEYLDRFLAALKESGYRYITARGTEIPVGKRNFAFALQASWNEASKAAREADATAKFVPPTLDEVTAWFKEQSYKRDPKAFWLYYQGTGWRTGRTLIADWKALAGSWECNADLITTKTGGINGRPKTNPSSRNRDWTYSKPGFTQEKLSRAKHL